jgi:para-nitrobenzyl esterase
MTCTATPTGIQFAPITRQLARPRLHTLARNMSVSILALSLAACGGGADTSTDSTDPLLVTTAQGPVQGRLSGNTAVFLGVPYAESPVGARRWKAPAALAVRSGTYTAQEAKSGCTVAEDCLYLNIYKPAKASAASKLPVLMYIHGGGLGAGTPNDFDGSALANDNGVVVVTIAYRLGALGFLAHPALTAEAGGSSGNYGMLDQQAAMAWIRANIQGFGGDPANTTIFGQSAGGYSVYTHLASPLAAGLFDKAVVSSGAYMRIQPTLATAETFGQSDASKWGCTGTDAEVLACLRPRRAQAPGRSRACGRR